jgi:hypothetical protein
MLRYTAGGGLGSASTSCGGCSGSACTVGTGGGGGGGGGGLGSASTLCGTGSKPGSSPCFVHLTTGCASAVKKYTVAVVLWGIGSVHSAVA